MEKKIPTWLKHKPLLAVDYSDIDAESGAGDAKFLSLGKATWNEEDCSAKVWRYSDENDKWQRGSEELPLWRVLDLAKLVVAKICGVDSGMEEEPVENQDTLFLKDYIKDNMSLYIPRIHKLKEILNYSESIAEYNRKAPNIFSFATSELSQDAMFAYLIKWADPKNMDIDKEMCQLGQSFLKLLTSSEELIFNSVEVGRQWRNIDIWVEINDDTILIIEDKTNTSIHDNQLDRYRAIIEEEYEGKRNIQLFTYVKTGNEPKAVLEEINKKGYKTINRSQILVVLNTYRGNNPIVLNYKDSLQALEDATNSYINSPIDKWNGDAWQGFYMNLEQYIEKIQWGYVPIGDFWGAWWHKNGPKNNGNLEMYLQFEESKMCIKICYDGPENKTIIRNKCYETLIETAAKKAPEIVRPDKFGAGTFMTIGVVKPEHLFGDKIINVQEILTKLWKYEEIVDTTIKILETRL